MNPLEYISNALKEISGQSRSNPNVNAIMAAQAGAQAGPGALNIVLNRLGLKNNIQPRDPNVNAIYQKYKSQGQLSPDEAKIINQRALESMVNTVGQVAGTGKKVDTDFMDIRRTIDKTPIQEVYKQSTQRFFPTRAEFARMSEAQRRALAQLRNQVLGENTANFMQ